MRHGFRQIELAESMGYEQTYISALEIGKKGPPTPEFVDRLIQVLELSSIESEQIREAAEASQRKVVITDDVPEDVYWMLKALRDRLPKLCSRQARIIQEILCMNDGTYKDEAEPVQRIKRRAKTEARM
jgi:transcriptional regulator with XRE-family HTH domain